MPILSSIIEKDIAIDLGTDTTILYVAGSGIRLREPTVVAMDRQTGRVLKVGEDARRMLGRTHRRGRYLRLRHDLRNAARIHPPRDELQPVPLARARVCAGQHHRRGGARDRERRH